MPTLKELLAAAKARKTFKEEGTPLRVFLLLISKGDPKDLAYTIAFLSQWLAPIVAPLEIKPRNLTVWEYTPVLQSVKNWTGIPLSVIYDTGKDIKWQKYPW